VHDQTTAGLHRTRAQDHADSVPDIGLALLRIAVGLIIAAHGAQKLFGLFGGGGLEGTTAYFEKLGYAPAALFAPVAAVSEFAGGLLLALGLFTPLAAAMVLGVMTNAVAADWSEGLLRGYEYPLILAILGVMFACTGPGRYSLDEGRSWNRHGPRWAAASIALGLVAAIASLLFRMS
jgi:putative oxidoreductase